MSPPAISFSLRHASDFPGWERPENALHRPKGGAAAVAVGATGVVVAGTVVVVVESAVVDSVVVGAVVVGAVVVVASATVVVDAGSTVVVDVSPVVSELTSEAVVKLPTAAEATAPTPRAPAINPAIAAILREIMLCPISIVTQASNQSIDLVVQNLEADVPAAPKDGSRREATDMQWSSEEGPEVDTDRRDSDPGESRPHVRCRHRR